MASPTKRAWKLNEFVAHSDVVNCLALGHKSGRVLVTGGGDRKVNMWAVGKPNCIMSLTGHTSPIETVRFSNAEEMVAAGSMSGALKIWDLEQAKIKRTLTGHKSTIRSLDFHPYDEFVASGSLDTNMKLWDIRRKGCIFTYKGHIKSVNCIRFSPDGRWIVTAGEDGILKLWDITAGKLLSDFKLHTGPVNAVEFHPNEFLLASGSADRTVKFWDLETFQLVSTTDGESTPVRSLFFHPEGTCIYTGCHDALKVFGWEPARCYDSVSMGWSKVSDVAIAQNQLIGATFSQSNVSTFVADIERIQPLGGPVHIPPPSTPVSATRVTSGRRSFGSSERPPTQSTKQAPISLKEDHEDQAAEVEDDTSQSYANITDPADYNEIFHPNKTLAHTPPKNLDPFPAPQDDGMVNSATSSQKKQQPPVKVISAGKPAKPTVIQALTPAVHEPFQPPPVPQNNAQKESNQQDSPPKNRSPQREEDSVQQTEQPTQVVASEPVQQPKQQPAPKKPIQQKVAQKKSEISADDFLPAAVGQQGSSIEMTESDTISSITKGHDSMSTVMNNRGKNLQIVRALYSGGNMKTAMDAAVGMDDKAIIVDLFNVMIQRQSLWNLDLCTLAVPQIKELLNSKYENYVSSACSTLKLILRMFASVIKANLTAPPSMGVDVQREERFEKCKRCYQQLMDIRSIVSDKVAAAPGKVGTKFRELLLLMGQLD